MTAPAVLANAMSEEDLLRCVLDAARALGWRSAHFRPAKTERGWRTAVQGDGKGFPDLVLVSARMNAVIWIELKSQTGRLDPNQETWRDVLLSAGERWFCFKPSDWLNGCVMKVLEGVT